VSDSQLPDAQAIFFSRRHQPRKATASGERAAEALAQTGDLYWYQKPKVLAPAFD
jgi:hypothetical protein